MIQPVAVLFLVCMMAIRSIAHHDSRCNSPDVQICVDSERDQNGKLNLLCVDSRREMHLTGEVQWLKNGALHMDSTGRIRKQGARLIFENILISDEANWTCSNGSLSPPFKLYAGKVNYHMELATLNGTVGNNISIPCNIELGVNTAQTNYRVTITRRVFYNDESNQLSLIMNYRNNMDPKILSVNNTATDPTSYQFYSSNLTLYVENFSVPSPQDVLGVKFTCRFYVVIQGMATTTATKTAVIFGFHPPEITRSLENVTVIRQGNSYSFIVEVYSHPSSRRFWWRLNGDEISTSDPSFVIKPPITSGNTSTYNLTITNASEKHSGVLKFTAKLGNSTASTQTLLIIPPQVEKMQLLNSCEHVTYADGPLNINLTLSSALPEFSQPFTDPLSIQLRLNLSLIPKIPSQGIDSIRIVTHEVDILSDEFLSQWRGGKSVQLRVDKTAILGNAMSRIMSRGERFRAQVKLAFNEVTAAEWSPVCESPIFQPCLDPTSAEIKLKLKFSPKDQCSTHSANEVKREIEDLLRQKFSCDNITVWSANEYHCNQDDRVIFLKANVSTYYAQDRVNQFYSYLQDEKFLILNDTVELIVPDLDDSTAEQSSDSMVYLYAFIGLLIVFVIVFFIIATVLVIRKRSFKPKDPENEDGSRPPSSASSSRSQNFYVEDRSLSRSPMSPTSNSSSVFTRTNHTHNHAPHSVHTPPHSSHSSHSLQDHTSHYSEEPSGQGIPLHQGISHHHGQVIDLEEDNTAAIPLHCVQYLPSQGPHVASTAGHETTTRTFLSEQEIRGNQQSRAESSAFGDDNISLNDSEHRLRFMDSPAMRSTPSSGYHSSSRQSSSLSRYHHHQKAPRQRHNTEGGHVHPVTALVQLPTTAGGGYLVLHGLDLADRQRTSSASQLQPPTVVQASNVIQVQPAAMSLADMQQRACEMNLPRSREHLKLPLPGGAVHTSRELRTVVPCEVMSPHRRLSDPSPLSGSPREFCNLGGRGEEFSRQNTSGAESNSSEESIN